MILISDRDIDSNDILSNEKLHKENNKCILIDEILDKTSMGTKPLHIRFDKINRLI